MSICCRPLLVAFLLVLLAPLTAHAWSDAGHRIIAAIAWRQLSPRQRAIILDTLSHHPRYAEDFRRHLPDKLTDVDDHPEWFFQQAAVWPDIARGLPEPQKALFHHGTWHYINHPLHLLPADQHHDIADLELNLHLRPPRDAEETMNIVQVIRFSRRELQQHHRPESERALWLTWLFHTVGDLHQPLHSTTMINAARLPGGDRGGNTINTKQRSNLHALWDNFPGEKIQIAESRKRALTWMNDPELKARALPASRELNEEVWWRESRHLSETVVYDEEVRSYLKHLPEKPITKETPRLTLSEEYLERGGHISRVRILEAGFRLGAVLNELFP